MAYEWPASERTAFEQGLAELDLDVQESVLWWTSHGMPPCDEHCAWLAKDALRQGQALQAHKRKAGERRQKRAS